MVLNTSASGQAEAKAIRIREALSMFVFAPAIGVMFWLLSVEYGLTGPMSAIVTGMAGYMGGEAIKLLEERVVTAAGK